MPPKRPLNSDDRSAIALLVGMALVVVCCCCGWAGALWAVIG